MKRINKNNNNNKTIIFNKEVSYHINYETELTHAIKLRSKWQRQGDGYCLTDPDSYGMNQSKPLEMENW